MTTGTAADAPPDVPPDAASTAPVVRVMGVRHHGPGSARAVAAALEELQPDVVLIEGPADADPLAVLAADPDLRPPVALLAYATDAPSQAAFWPFAVFSPEWQALTWAAAHEVPVRFCDLPSGAVLAARTDGRDAPAADGDADGADGAREADGADGAGADPAADGDAAGTDRAAGADADGADQDADAPRDADGGGPDAGDPEPSTGGDVPPARDGHALRTDPVAQLASAAGYTDPERWWEDVVEHRRDGAAPFAVLTEAMAALREAAEPLPAHEAEHEERREAHMRQTLRAVLKSGARRVAVVCGAWHAPALDGKLPPASHDAKVLRGLPKRPTATTWVPWTASRLAFASGYGAGVTSPGWYHHLFTTETDVTARWMVRVAGVLRAEDLPVSSAHAIEATRLADALAVMRGRPHPGLEEVTEAIRAVMCDGDDLLLELVTGRLVVGEALGTVPGSVPTVPLEADLRATGRRLRLKLDAVPRDLALDLRKDTDRDRSTLLRRLRLLGVHWGTPQTSAVRSTGTFRETWSLAWKPELSVAVVDAAMWGTTVPGAATAKVVDTAGNAALPALTGLVEDVLAADLPDALGALLSELDARAARDVDTAHLMAALPALVRAERYTDVRGTRTTDLTRVVDALVIRTCAALPAAVSSLDDDAAARMRDAVDAVHAAVMLRDPGHTRDLWLATLAGLADRPDLAGVLAGRVTRLLRETGTLSTQDAATRFGRALSVGATPPHKAAWVEGFLAGTGLLLARDTDLLDPLDTWVATLDEQEFTDVLPLLRRTFGGFAPAERRAVGDAVRRTTRPGATLAPVDVDEDLAAPALAAVALILGVSR
ncbi:DUF5682 family protein [Cellulomonas fimi]|uniref:Uncharacterized protein n=1 Tax=Cellulomonas fimi (strain ATCC 484 / DSM 20113 / JCM 1341 / CCUG 24087 / LMG 16345 / NBRC 15513 / NCIMB 8980 / NCTC 7547 / NRS-133) TaxID=590998 RepID=F4GZH3_CELFA|nr:DUF5682 family protein [Cellulomonas fimi]AEE44894.1 hypothetical protein Celf_0754 [Cellulomonas fimi ATCC 484]NNH08266.1 hypothetical protein [Cellulomonas fimi]VEH27604.1 Uncharacterised protein [Cellulomonas fimi]